MNKPKRIRFTVGKLNSKEGKYYFEAVFDTCHEAMAFIKEQHAKESIQGKYRVTPRKVSDTWNG